MAIERTGEHRNLSNHDIDIHLHVLEEKVDGLNRKVDQIINDHESRIRQLEKDSPVRSELASVSRTCSKLEFEVDGLLEREDRAIKFFWALALMVAGLIIEFFMRFI